MGTSTEHVRSPNPEAAVSRQSYERGLALTPRQVAATGEVSVLGGL